jgi:predicted Zn finger-like uncharacterized protein
MTPGSGEAAGAASPPPAGADRLALDCPHCGLALRVRREYAGRQVRCGKCGQKFTVPRAAEPAASAGGRAGAPASGPEPDLFDQLYAAQDEARSVVPPPRPMDAAEEQLAALGGECDRLRVELELLRREQESSESEREPIRADRDALRAEVDRLRGKLARSESGREGDREAARKLAAELAAIRDALGPISPAEVGTLREEHAAFRSQADDLRGRVQSLESELSARGELVEALGRRDEELRTARGEAERAREEVGQLERDLEAAHGGREELARELQSLRDQLAGVQGERDELGREVGEHRESSRAFHARGRRARRAASP